jgi:hypothetical protein
MKIQFASTVTFAFLLSSGIAVAADSLPSYNSMRTPASPAFALLGVAPSEIEKPSSPADIAILALNKTNNFSAIPKHFAVETSPYWLFLRPNLSWKEDTTRCLGASLARTGTLSLATAQIGDSARPVTGFAFAIKGSLISGSMSPKAIRTIAYTETTMMLESDAYRVQDSTINASCDSEFQKSRSDANGDAAKVKAAAMVRQKCKDSHKDSALTSKDYLRKVDSIRAARYPKLDELTDLQELAAVRQGFLLDVAAGSMWSFPDNVADSGRFDKFSIWLTPAYALEKFDAAGVIRMAWSGRDDSLTALDFGGKLTWANKSYALSGEGVSRYRIESEGRKWQWKIDGTFEFEAFNHQWLTISFGKDFQDDAKNSLYALVGWTFNLADQRFHLDPK